MIDGLTKNRVLPLPEPPMTRIFLFLAYFAYSASTEKHFPTTSIGMLEVFLPESYFIQQRYTVYDGSRMYIRGNYGGTWSSWHTVSLTTVT